MGAILKDEYVKILWSEESVMSLKLEIEGVILNVVSVNAPQVGFQKRSRIHGVLDEAAESISRGSSVRNGEEV